MKTDFKFTNLLGQVYCQGNLLFDPEGTHLFSPVGNRVSIFNLVDNKSYTLPFAHRNNISRIALSPRGNLLLSVDEVGIAILTNIPRRIPIYQFSLRSPVHSLAFSPCGRFFAAGLGRRIEVWHVPSTPDANVSGEIEFAPFVRHHTHTQHTDDVHHIQWSSDSRFFLSASRDGSARIWSLHAEEGFVPTALYGHKQAVVGAWFSESQEIIYTVSRDGAVFEWQYTAPLDADQTEEEVDPSSFHWRPVKKNYFMQGSATVRCAALHPHSNLLVAGFSNGVFRLYEMPDFNQVHTLSISQNDIDFVTINQSGEWLAFGASKLGQLLVWEWQSESYILKQQGHFDSINALTYSPDGKRVVTTADDGKIKVWDVDSGFCIVTFTEHTSGVTACEFAKKGNVLFTASLDGSIRAWDLIRYRNFRTFTAPTRLSFSSMAVDPSGEVVAAGSLDSFDVHIWSVQTGQLLDRMAGHEGPVSALAFTADGSHLVSGSWDHTARIWSIFGRLQTSEPLQLQADVLAVAVRPDSQQIAISTLDGQLTFWNVHDGLQVGGLDGRRDVSGGRKDGDRRTAANSTAGKSFSTIRYSTDGACILAGGDSKYICLYSVSTMVLLKKYTVSVNLSLQGTTEFLNSKKLTEAGAIGLIDDQGRDSDGEGTRASHNALPGSRRGDPSARKIHPEIRVTSVGFSPDGASFCAASSEGLLIYSVDTALTFDPFDLRIEVTPASTLAVLENDGDYLKALVMAFRLNDNALLKRVFQATPHGDIGLVVAGLPTVYLQRLLRFVAMQTEDSPHIEFCLLWVRAIVDKHGPWLLVNRAKADVELRVVSRAISRMRDEIRRLADDNIYMVDYLVGQAKARKEPLRLGAVEVVAVKKGTVQDGEDFEMEEEEEEEEEESGESDGEWEGLE